MGSGSYLPWAELMRRTLGIDPACCRSCEGRLEPIAVITRDDIVERILSHLHLPTAPEPIGPGGSLAWEVGMDPEPADMQVHQRGPPPCDDCVDPPAPD